MYVALMLREKFVDLLDLDRCVWFCFPCGRGGGVRDLLADLRHFFTRLAVFRDKRIPFLLAAWTLGTYV